MEDKGGATISETGELWVIKRPYPQRNSGSKCWMEGQSTSERDSVSPDHSQTDFGAAELLSNSVYLWACDESPSGTRPSRSDAYVAWVILIIKMACYIQLIYISSSTPQQDLSSTTEKRYSIVSVAVTMYLMTSIAAVDLTAGIALLIEGRTLRSVRQRGANVSVQEMNGVRWLQRKLVGLTLISSFGLLAAASIAILFKSPFEDVDRAVGAATVLFIANADENAMFVLKIIPSKWRLFCVLEVVGLSVALALLVLRAMGYVAEIGGEGHAGCILVDDDQIYATDCGIYSWFFIVYTHPMLVTILSLLLNTIIIVSPKQFLEKHIFESNSLKNWVFLFVLTRWVLQPILFICGFYGSIFLCYILFLWLGVCIRLRRGSWRLIASCRSVRCSTSNTYVRLYLVAACLSFIVIILVPVAGINLGPSVAFSDAYFAMEAILHVLFGVWLVWAIFPRGNSVQDEAHETPVPAIGREPGVESQYGGFGKRFKLTTDLIFGWVQALAIFEAFNFVNVIGDREADLPFYAIYWLAWIGVGICAASSNEKGVVFWTATTWLLFDVYNFICVWGFAKVSRGVE